VIPSIGLPKSNIVSRLYNVSIDLILRITELYLTLTDKFVNQIGVRE